MARPSRRRPSRARRTRSKGTSRFARILAVLVLLAFVGGAWAWWEARGWRPDEAAWPDQGAMVTAEDGPVAFATLKGLGANFAYLKASEGARTKDRSFPDNVEAARTAGLQVGAVLVFDPCVPADGQSANFVTMVPRDADMLPPAIALERTAKDCPERVTRTAIQSELMTLVNQIEAHAGQPVILKVSPGFEEHYGIAARIERNLWLERDWFEPDYGGRPWLLWTANGELQTEAAEEPLHWVVVRP